MKGHRSECTKSEEKATANTRNHEGLDSRGLSSGGLASCGFPFPHESTNHNRNHRACCRFANRRRPSGCDQEERSIKC